MLVLSRHRDETVMIGDDVQVTVVDIRGDKVRLGINAPRDLGVHRKEVYDAIRRENLSAARLSAADLASIPAGLPQPASVRIAQTPAQDPQPFVRSRDTLSHRLAIAGDLYSFIATGEQTANAFAMFDIIVFPGGGPPMHIHRREEETFHVVEGTVLFSLASGPVQAGPGTTLFMPRGTPHTFSNTSSAPARMIVTVTPAGLDRFFNEIGRPVADPTAPVAPPTPEEIQRILHFAPSYGLEILPNP